MEIHIGNRVAEVELKSKEGNKVLLTIDGKEFEVDIMIVENGYYLGLRSVFKFDIRNHYVSKSYLV